MKTLGIYVQIPFCATKCSFCNFSSRVERSSAFDLYCEALDRELARLPEIYRQHGIGQGLLHLPVDTAYFGGGTPGLLGMERLGRVVQALRRRFHVLSTCEFTLEATPG